MNDGSNNNSNGRAAELPPERGDEELLLYCKSESLSEEGLHQIIERYGWTPNTSLNSSDYGFFRVACRNERVTEAIIRCLLEYFPRAASASSQGVWPGWSPLHIAFNNKNVTLGIIQAIVDAAPNSVRSVTNMGTTPLQFLCLNNKVDEMASVEILTMLIENYPEVVRHTDNGDLPIHYAAKFQSLEFCRLLIEAYPQSKHMASNKGELPLHIACGYNNLAVVEYLYQQYPSANNHAVPVVDYYPIHFAIYCPEQRDEPAAAAAEEIVRFLLDCDPNEKLKRCDGKSLLEYACGRYSLYDSNIDAGIQIIKTIYDAHPEAIYDLPRSGDFRWFHRQIHAFVIRESVYSLKATDLLREMNIPDDNGQLPLHRALQNNVRLGSIKLLVKGNPSALRTLDYNFALPIHIACESHNSTEVIEYLLGLDRRTLRAADIDNNTALHYACRGAKYDSIALLLEKYYAALVSKRNADGKIPIDLLWESNQVSDRESVEYLGSVFQLLRAYPEMLVTSNCTEKQLNDADATRHGKKRKLCRADEV